MERGHAHIHTRKDTYALDAYSFINTYMQECKHIYIYMHAIDTHSFIRQYIRTCTHKCTFTQAHTHYQFQAGICCKTFSASPSPRSAGSGSGAMGGGMHCSRSPSYADTPLRLYPSPLLSSPNTFSQSSRSLLPHPTLPFYHLLTHTLSLMWRCVWSWDGDGCVQEGPIPLVHK